MVVSLAVALVAACQAQDPAPGPGVVAAAQVGPQALGVDRLTDTQRERLAIAGVPVLLPDVDGLERAIMTAGPGWYAASMVFEDHTVAIHGTRVAFVEPELGLDGQRAPDVVTRVHAIAELSFLDGDVAYSVEVDCERPLENPRCTEDATVRALRAAMRPATLGPAR